MTSESTTPNRDEFMRDLGGKPFEMWTVPEIKRLYFIALAMKSATPQVAEQTGSDASNTRTGASPAESAPLTDWLPLSEAPMFVCGRDALVGEWVEQYGWKKVSIWEREWTRDDIISRGGTHWWPHLRDLPQPINAAGKVTSERGVQATATPEVSAQIGHGADPSSAAPSADPQDVAQVRSHSKGKGISAPAESAPLTEEQIDAILHRHREPKPPHTVDRRRTTDNEIITLCDLALRGLRDSRAAKRYQDVRENGVPCCQGDACGSPAGEELDATVDKRIAAMKEPK